MALTKDNPKNKLVDGKVLEHVLLLLKGYIESNNKDNLIIPIEVYNTDSEQVKELVYDIIYGQEEEKPDDDELVNKDIPLVSYLINYIDKRIKSINAIEELDCATEEDIINMFKHAGVDTELGMENFECLKHIAYVSEEDIYNLFEKEDLI